MRQEDGEGVRTMQNAVNQSGSFSSGEGLSWKPGNKDCVPIHVSSSTHSVSPLVHIELSPNRKTDEGQFGPLSKPDFAG